VSRIPPIHRNPSIRYSRAARERAGGKGAYDAEIRALGLEPGVELRIERVQPPARVAELLGVEAGEVSTVVRARLMTASDGETRTITQLADSYIPLDIAADTVLERPDEGVGGMVSRMAEMGYAQVRVSESVAGRVATADEARQLGISEDQHVFALEHVGWTEDGRAVEVALHVMPQHLWILDSEFPCD
jgi:GntR family transcriptional regulator